MARAASGRTGWSTTPRPGDRARRERRSSTTAAACSATRCKALNERERRIFEARRLAEDPLTLEELSSEFGVSRERVRQIEVRAFEKVQKAVKKAAGRGDSGSSRRN